MSHFTTFPFLRLTLIWINGIIVATYYGAPLNVSFIVLGIVLSCYMISFFKKSTNNLWRNCIGCLVVFVTSYVHTLVDITQQQNNLRIENTITAYQASIKQTYLTSTYGSMAQATINHVKDTLGWHNSVIGLQLYFSKKCNYIPAEGDILLIRGAPIPYNHKELYQKAIPKLASLYRQVHYYHKLKSNDFIVLSQYTQVSSWSNSIRQWLHNAIERSVPNKEAIALIHTLLFGTKGQLSNTLRKAYTHTGTIHVLVVSGLHVNMLYHIIHTLVTFLFKRYSRYLLLSNLLTFVVLWMYAWLCHFTPPVLRATIMLTIANIGLRIGRTTDACNGLFISAFVLLLWKPLLLYNCGFQLSYAATLGIHYLQPAIQSALNFNNHWIKKIGYATSLSIAAQISTLPLIIYYFNVFPIYFIISNWLIVPAMFVILIASFVLIATTHFPIINTLLGWLLSKFIIITNQLVYWIAQWPYSTLQISLPNGYSVYLLYVIIISIYLFFKYKSLFYPAIISACLTYFMVIQMRSIIEEQDQVKIIFYNDNNNCTFTLKDHTTMIHYHELQANLNTPYLQSYTGAILAAWYGKIIFFVKTIPADWCRWQYPPLKVDFVCITSTLLPDIDILLKIFKSKTWVIYGDKTYIPYYIRKYSHPSTTWIWVQPGKQKAFTWSKKGLPDPG